MKYLLVLLLAVVCASCASIGGVCKDGDGTIYLAMNEQYPLFNLEVGSLYRCVEVDEGQEVVCHPVKINRRR